MPNLRTSGKNLHCGTHAVGHSIYLHWDELTQESRGLVIQELNEFYKLNNEECQLTVETFKGLMDQLSYDDIQRAMSLPLNAIIRQNLINLKPVFDADNRKNEQTASELGQSPKYYQEQFQRMNNDPICRERTLWSQDQLSIALCHFKIRHSISARSLTVAGITELYGVKDRFLGAEIKIQNTGNHWESQVDELTLEQRTKNNNFGKDPSIFVSDVFSFFNGGQDRVVRDNFKKFVIAGSLDQYNNQHKIQGLQTHCRELSRKIDAHIELKIKEIKSNDPDGAQTTRYEDIKKQMISLSKGGFKGDCKELEEQRDEFVGIWNDIRPPFGEDTPLIQLIDALIESLVNLITQLAEKIQETSRDTLNSLFTPQG
ncbi:MAG TPA: hypothetical protein QF353_00380 [Gammaproteobacteria bacterium]|nr:hypothetical protein [Gammaproteobacteria bacterium]